MKLLATGATAAPKPAPIALAPSRTKTIATMTTARAPLSPAPLAPATLPHHSTTPTEETMPVSYPTQQSYRTYAPASASTSISTGATAPPSVVSTATGPANIPAGPTANGANTSASPMVTVEPVSIAPSGWSSWSTTKKALVVGGGVVGLAAAVGIVKALVR